MPLTRVRPIRSADRDAVLRMHMRCSRETRYLRWLAPVLDVPRSYLSSVLAGTADHIAVVAVADREPAGVVGLASAALTSTGWRELGFLVEDRFQAQGVGNQMMGSLIDLLDPDESICAYSLIENRWSLSKLARYGAPRFSYEAGVSLARIDRKAKSQ
jgi:GNAT superfamily N-acetyltransferase